MRPGRAQEVELTGPRVGACTLPLRRHYVPAHLEWAFWNAGGMAVADHRATSLTVGSGAEITTGVLTYDGFPARSHTRSGGEVRLGPWGYAETRSAGALVETGLTAHVGALDHGLRSPSAFAMFDLRGAAGYGEYGGRGSPHWTIALGVGYRTVFDRLTYGWDMACGAVREPDWLADATFARIVTSYRRTTELPGWELTFMLEMTPTVALIGSRLAAPPRR